MAFDRALPPPIFGISTIAEKARPEGFAERQVNWRNDVQDKLVRRPKTKFSSAQLPASQINASAVDTEVFFRDGVRHEIIVYSDNLSDVLETFYRVGNGSFTRRELDVGAAWLSGEGDIGINMIDSDFYIWNRNNTISTETVAPIDPDLYERTSLVNVISALNYAETVELTLTVNAITLVATYTVPGLTADNQAEADEARATNTVATALAGVINADAAFTAVAKGSNIVITTSEVGELNVEVSSGRGSGTVEVLNRRISSPEFMPKFCTPSVVRAVSANPRNSEGTYYLKATPIKTGATGVVEVIWTETRSPTGALKFTDTSFIVKYDTSTGTLTKFTFKEQLAGDSESNPALDFVGEKIEYISEFQNRLTILAGSRVSFSKTDDFRQFWKGSAIETLVSDPTSVGTSGNSSTLRKALYHNRDLLIFADNAQFKLDGTTALTPQTAAMPRTTSNECDLSVSPVQMGADVYYAINYGNSVGIRRFEVQKDTSVDASVSITDHVIGLMRGRITELVSNANQDLLIVRTDESDAEQFYVFEVQKVGDELIPSWAEWRLADGMAIDKIDIFNEVVTIRYNTKHYVTCNLREREDLPASAICLDNYVELTGVGDTVTLPAQWDLSLGLPVALLGDDGIDQLVELYGIQFDHTINLGEDVDGKKVIVGYKYRSEYQPSRLFRRGRNGEVRTKDRLRLTHYLLELANTYRLSRSIISEHWDIPEEVVTGNDGFTNQFIDEVKPYDGLWKTSVGMNTLDCQVVFKADSPYTANIVSIEYTGQLFSTTSRR